MLYKPRRCKVRLLKENFYLYPDVFLTCDERDKKNNLFKNFPSIIFEVLSDSTALYDKEVKLKYYKRIESLKYYVLVAQKEVMVEVYSRISNTQIWKYQTFETINEMIEFEDLVFALPLAIIYDGIEFEAV